VSDGLEALTEETIFYIRQSRAIQLARVEAYLDGVVLAAEQVQDVRITLLSEPPEVSGWQAAGSVLLTFVLESSIPGKVLSRVASLLFKPILQMNVVFRALPKSPEGKALIAEARRLARMSQPGTPVIVPTGSGLVRNPTGRPSREAVFAAVLQAGAGGRGGLRALGKENVILYHAWLEDYVKRGSLEQDLSAVVKSVVQNQAVLFKKPSAEGSAIPRMESPAVAIRGAAYEYASLTKLGIQIHHDRLECLVRQEGFSPVGLESVVQLCEWEELDANAQRDQLQRSGLTAVRQQFALLFEAIIWARLEGFRPPRHAGDPGAPTVTNNDSFFGIDKRLSDYWLNRFAGVLAARERVSEEEWTKKPTDWKLFRLQKYFWGIVTEMPRL
jgi:hypothetical protein